LNGKCGLVNQTCQEIILIYDEVLFPSNGLLSAQKNGKYGVINLNNEVIVDFVYERISRFQEGYAPVENGYKFGYIDTTGSLVIDLKYDYANSFVNGMAFVIVGDHCFYINKYDNIIYSSNRLNINKLIHENISFHPGSTQK
jgi:WG containing repeat